MAIAYKSAGTATATGTTSAIFNYPAGITAGDMIVLGVVNKYPPNAPGTLSGYTFPANGQGTGGAGTAGTDGGTVYTTAFYKIASGSESGAATVTVASGNSAGANVVVYSRTDAGYDWTTPVASNGADSTRGTAWSVTAGSTMDIKAGDMVIVVSGANADAQTYSAESLAMGGISSWTAHTERYDFAVTGGNDTRLVISDHSAAAGTATSAGTFTMTANGTLAAGASVFVRLREQWARGTVTPVDGLQAQTGDTASVYAAYAITPDQMFQAQTGDVASGTFTGITQSWNVTPADGFQAQTGDTAAVFAGYRVTPANSQQDQYQPDPPTVRAGYPATPQDGFQAQSGDAATVSYAGPTLSWSVTPVDGLQAQTGDTAGVSVGYVLSPAEGAQSQSGDGANVSAGYFITLTDGFQTQTMDGMTVTFAGAGSLNVTPEDGYQTQVMDLADVLFAGISVNPGKHSGYRVHKIRPGEASPTIWRTIPGAVSFTDESVEATRVISKRIPASLRKVPTKGTGGFKEKTEGGFSGFTKKGKR
jgi:hypothetical protein